MLVPGLLALALAASLAALPASFLVPLAIYVVLTAAYSFLLKRLAVVDVLLLAGLYTLRVLAGVEAARRSVLGVAAGLLDVPLPEPCVPEAVHRGGAMSGSADAAGRAGEATSAGDREWLGSMGSASGYLSVLVLALYINSEQVVALYRQPLLLWLVCPLLLFWTSRMWLLAHRGRIHDDPIVATVRDPVSYLIGLWSGWSCTSPSERRGDAAHPALPVVGPLPRGNPFRIITMAWRSDPPRARSPARAGPALCLRAELRRQLPQRRRPAARREPASTG